MSGGTLEDYLMYCVSFFDKHNSYCSILFFKNAILLYIISINFIVKKFKKKQKNEILKQRSYFVLLEINSKGETAKKKKHNMQHIFVENFF